MAAPAEKVTAARLVGTVKFYDPCNEFGFITGNHDGVDRFFNSNHLQEKDPVKTGDQVSFIHDVNRRGPLADKVRLA